MLRRLPWLTVDSLIIGFLVGLFGYAAIDKIFHVPGFVKALDSYRMLPIPIGNYLAPLIIAAELAVAVGLAYREWRRTAALSAAILMGIFTLGLIGNRLSGKDAICGCWFSISMAQGDSHFALNGIVIAFSLFVWGETPPQPAALQQRPAAAHGNSHRSWL